MRTNDARLHVCLQCLLSFGGAASEMDAGRSSSANLASAVGTTLAAQGQRVAAFKAWDAAIAEYLKEGDAVVYRQQVNLTFMS